jgi:Leucine-rich repeat (LRR) protein
MGGDGGATPGGAAQQEGGAGSVIPSGGTTPSHGGTGAGEGGATDGGVSGGGATDGGVSNGGATDGGASGGGGAPPEQCAGTVVFADRQVEKAVVDALLETVGSASLEAEDLAAVDSLLLNVSGAKTLAGLECVPRITRISLYDCPELEDLSPLAGLKELLDVNLERTGIRSLESLGSPPKLMMVHVGASPLVSLSADLTALVRLELQDTEVTDLSPLAGHQNLAELSVSDSPLADLTPLSSVGSLQAFTAYDTAIAEVAPLGQLPLLELLIVKDSQITGATSFSGFAALTELDLQGNPLGSLPNLADLEMLTVLGASNANLSSAHLPTGSALRQLFLYDNPLSDVSGLAAAGDLETLALSGNADTPLGLAGHIDALGSLSNLTHLTLHHADGQALGFLADLDALQYLNLEHVDSIATASIPQAASLRNLSLVSSTVDSAAFLSAMGSQLLHLRFADTNITDLTPLVQNAAFTGSNHSLYIDGSTLCPEQAANLQLLHDRQISGVQTCD